MKIRINKNNKIIKNKIVVNESAKNILTEADQMVDDMASNEEFKKLAESSFVDAQKRKSLVTGIIMPSALMTEIDFPHAPIDLRNVMQDIEVLKLEKQENNRGMLHDPVKTFNHSSDYANELFGNNKLLKFGKKSKTSIKNGNDGKEKDIKKYESLNYPYLYSNETIAKNGIIGLSEGELVKDAGKLIGSTAVDSAWNIGVGANSIMGGMLIAAAEIAVATAPSTITCYAIGYGLGKLGDVNSGAVEDDSQIHDSNEETRDLSDPKAIYNPNVIENINSYIDKIVNSTSIVLKDIAADKLENATELKKKVKNLMVLSDKLAAKYLEENAGIFKELAEKKKKEVENELNLIKAMNQSAANILKELNKKLIDPKFKIDVKTIAGILKDISDLLVDANNEVNKSVIKRYEDAIKSKDPNEIVQVYQRRKENVSESAIFESENENGKPKSIDLTDYYNTLKSEFETIIDPMFPLRGGENLPRVKNAKSRMETLITKATEEINSKIDQVCRIANSGDNLGLSGKMAAFISKHPLRASTLKGEWARHEDELKGRMETRLEAMANYDDPNYVIGWSATICKQVVPEVLARMFTYRYALQLLINNDFYTFDSNLETKAKEEFNNSYSDIMASVNYRILWALYQSKESYTIDGSDLLIVDESTEYGYSIDLSKTAYLIFLVYSIVEPVNFYEKDDNGYIKGIVATKTLYNCKTIGMFILNIGILCGADRIDVTDISQMETMVKRFTCPLILNDQSKQAIEDTYNYILNLLTNNISEIDNKTTLSRIYGYPEIIKNTIDIDNVNNIKKQYLEAKNNTQKNVVMKSLLLALNISDPKKCPVGPRKAKSKDAGKIGYNDFINRIKSNKNSIDHFGLIMILYYSFGLNELLNNNDPMNTVEEVCKNVKNILFLLSSNILNIGQELSIDMGAIALYIDACNSLYDKFESLIDAVNETDGGTHANDLEKLYNLCKDDNKLYDSFIKLCVDPKQAYKNNSSNELLKFFKSNTKLTNTYINGEYVKEYGGRINPNLDLNGMFTNDNIKTLADLLKSKIEDLLFNSNDSRFRLQLNSIINNLNYLIVYTLVTNTTISEMDETEFNNICRLYWDSELYKNSKVYLKLIKPDKDKKAMYDSMQAELKKGIDGGADHIKLSNGNLSDIIIAKKGVVSFNDIDNELRDTYKDDMKKLNSYYTTLTVTYQNASTKLLYKLIYNGITPPFTY